MENARYAGITPDSNFYIFTSQHTEYFFRKRENLDPNKRIHRRFLIHDRGAQHSIVKEISDVTKQNDNFILSYVHLGFHRYVLPSTTVLLSMPDDKDQKELLQKYFNIFDIHFRSLTPLNTRDGALAPIIRF